nr:DUF1579 family protein [uncultured Allomuricauda sp.]
MIVNHKFDLEKKQYKMYLVSRYFLIIIVLTYSWLGLAQQTGETKSTKELSFLLGKWTVERIYRPENDAPRILQGTLECQLLMDGQFIQCTYEMQRSNKNRALDVVYYNYNSIHNKYESMWLSSTWPIKVLMQGDLITKEKHLQLKTYSKFLIDNDIIEYVQDELIISKNKPKSLQRKTYIRTSEDSEGSWKYHMLEKATLTNRY